MHFRFKDPTGKVVSLPDVTSLMRAIQDGIVTPKTPLAVGDDGAWHRAELVKAYREAAAVLQRLPAGHTLPEGPAPTQAPRATTAKVSAGAPAGLRPLAGLIVLLIAAAVGLRLWTASGDAGTRDAEGGLAPAVREVSNQLSLAFGDSVALIFKAHQDWLLEQRLDRRLRGAALKSPESVRALIVVSTRTRIEGDGLLPRTDLLARRMVARADSLSLSGRGLEGLAPAVEDVVAGWREDLERYAAYQFEAARAFEAMAEFLRSHQQAFAIRDERPVFLSRDDGARFNELWDQLSRLPVKERAWADRVLRRRPGWMDGLPQTQRPRFGASVLTVRD